MVLKNRAVWPDVFQPEIFERDIASADRGDQAEGRAQGQRTSMALWGCRRHIKEAKGLLRVGAQVENLHEVLVSGHISGICSCHGGWPVLPAKLDDIIETQENSIGMTALNAVLATTRRAAILKPLILINEERLKAL